LIDIFYQLGIIGTNRTVYMIYLARCSECYSGFPDGHECYEPDKIILSGSFFVNSTA